MKFYTVILCLVLALAAAGCQPPPPPPPRDVVPTTADLAPAPTAAVDVPAPTSAPDQPTSSAAPGVETGVVTTGAASAGTLVSTTGCAAGAHTNFVEARNATVTASDGSQWVVPSAVYDGPDAADIFNDCTGSGDNPNYASQLQTMVVDPDGVEITAYIFADNYFELYVNGKFVARDPIGFTPFNSNVVRFKAKYPITYAVKMVDWETHLGIGMEYDRNNVGDGGFIARFSDGSGTSAAWKVQPVYMAPLDSPACVNGRDSAACSTHPACVDHNPDSTCQALHFPIPTGWTLPAFDDSSWPTATIYAARDVTNQPAYMNYARLFASADFIWSRNLKIDNLVLARYTVVAAPK